MYCAQNAGKKGSGVLGVATRGHDQIVQVREVLGVSGQRGHGLDDRPRKHSIIGNRLEPDVLREDGIMSLRLES
jgi:hypothetical protein